MTTIEAPPLVGAGVDRVDGPRKVTGSAPYSVDFGYTNLAHAALVRSTVAAGRIRRIDAGAAEAAPGVLAVITHHNAPRLGRGPDTKYWKQPPPALQDDRVVNYGQYVAVVVAETEEQAATAARLVEVDYEAAEPLLDLGDPRAEVVTDPFGLDSRRGDVDAALASAEVIVDSTATMADETNNPMGLFATVAVWDGDSLTVHDATQYPYGTRATLAAAFGVPEGSVRVTSPFLGGGFGAGLRTWPHVALAALAARTVDRPVKLALTRPQMFTGLGHRSRNVQRIRLGATRTGELVAIDHEADATVNVEGENFEPITAGTATAYTCPNVRTRDRQTRLNVPDPHSMRAPGDSQGNFALESAMDELAYVLRMDPIELRLRNYAEENQQLGLPWSSKALRDCYEAGAERFGWWGRDPEPRSMRDRGLLVGYGMAGIAFFWVHEPCQARVTLRRDGTALVDSAGSDIGTGTYTIMTQLSAEELGLGLDQVRFELGDSDMPYSPPAGGSGLTVSLGNAIHATSRQLVRALLDLVAGDAASPLRGCSLDDVAVTDGRIHRRDDPTQGEAYTDILARHGMDELTVEGGAGPADPREVGMAPSGAFGAKFVEVHVDPDLGTIRVARVVSAIDGGRILNEKTARSQILGGTVGGIGMALLEETATDPGTGRIANATLADYLVAVNADVPDMDVLFVGEPDRFNPIGVKGIGEPGLVGIAPAIANAVFHATGKRVRSLPITLDKLM